MPKSFQYNDQLAAVSADTEADFITIKLGISAADNITLIRSSQPSWMWLHLDTIASGHVVIETDVLDQNLIDFAAHVCLGAVSSKKQKGAIYFKNNQQLFNVVVTKISNLLIDLDYLELGEVEFKSNSRRQLSKYQIIYKNDI